MINEEKKIGICAPVPLYFNDKSPFLCQQDLAYNIDNLLENFEKYSTEIALRYDSTIIQQLKFYLNEASDTKSFISFEDLYVDLLNGIPTNEFNEAIDDHIESFCCPFGQGSNLGCSGNYSGCCRLWSIHCLAHDLACLSCKPDWFCGPDCQTM